MGTPLPAGSPFWLNSVAAFSSDRSVATLKDGTFVVTWIEGIEVEREDGGSDSYSSVHGQVFYANGDKLGDEFIVSQPKPGDNSFFRDVHVAALKTGGFVVAYSHTPDAGFDNDDIWLRVYGADGSAGAEVVATQNTAHWQGEPEISALDDGGFILSYGSDIGESGVSGILSQRYASNGMRVGDSQTISSFGAAQSLVTLKNGNIVIADGEGEDGALRAHIYTPGGTELTPAGGIALPTTQSGYQIDVSLAALADGRFVAVWTQFGTTAEDPSVNSLRARIFTADGQPVGKDFQINVKTDGSQRGASVAALPNGGFAVAFADFDFNPDGASVRAQTVRIACFGADGSHDGEEVVVATGGPFSVDTPSLSALADGRLLLTYSELNKFRNPHSVAQVFDPRVEKIDWAGSDGEDNYVGTRFSDNLRGLAGQDRLYGNDGADTLDGGAGADSLDGGAGFDIASYAKAGSRVSVDLATKTGSLGEAAGDALSAIEGLVGSGFNDALAGDASANRLWGGLGKDTLTGGAGQDVFVFDTRPNRKSNLDKLVDFKVKEDVIWLDNKVFAKLGKAGSEAAPAQLKKAFFTIGPKAKDKNDYLVYDNKKGVLFYDADGSGKGKAVEIATLSKKLHMTNKDFFVI